jgi:pyruvate/2-oxoacid:ferredoxin oxidoreductase alpha subunit
MMRFGPGNQAVIDAALAAGCQLFAGYPVTPATEILEAAAAEFPRHGRVFIPTEGEMAAISLVAGASLGGYRAMTATSGLGLSLMAEGLSFYSGMTELPGVIVVQQRWGPGDGSLGPGQDCYQQATRGVGHGDLHLIVLAPKSVQELADHVALAFGLADRHRMFVLVLGDQIVAMTSERYEVAGPAEPARRDTGFGRGDRMILPELVAVDEKAGDFDALEAVARRWEAKYQQVRRHEQRAQFIGPVRDCDLLVIAQGSLARVAECALPELGAELPGGVGLFRPITLWPFPADALREAASRARRVVVAELSMGQMHADVAAALAGAGPPGREVGLVNWLGGRSPTPGEFARRVSESLGEPSRAGAR